MPLALASFRVSWAGAPGPAIPETSVARDLGRPSGPGRSRSMPRRVAKITQGEVALAIRAAKRGKFSLCIARFINFVARALIS